MPSRNATRLHKRNRTPHNSREPKPSGASGWNSAERYFRADMQVCPYGGSRNYVAHSGWDGARIMRSGGYRKFDGASGCSCARTVL